MIFDTDVLIWVFRGHEGAAQLVEGTDDRRISMVTYAEFIQGVRNRQELKKIKNLLNDFAFQTLPLTERYRPCFIPYICLLGVFRGSDNS